MCGPLVAENWRCLPGFCAKHTTQLYLRTFLILFLSPLRRVRIVIFLRKSGVLGRFRPGSGGNPSLYFYFGLKRSWGKVCPLTHVCLDWTAIIPRLWGSHWVYSMLCTSASGPEIGLPGRISAGFKSGQPPSRPSGRPSAGRSADFEVFPIRVRSKSDPEAHFPARKHHCVT